MRRRLGKNWSSFVRFIAGCIIFVGLLVETVVNHKTTLGIYPDEIEESFVLINTDSSYALDYHSCLRFDSLEKAARFLSFQSSSFLLVISFGYLLLSSTTLMLIELISPERLIRTFLIFLCDSVLIYFYVIIESMNSGDEACMASPFDSQFVPDNISWLFQVWNNSLLLITFVFLLRSFFVTKRFGLYLQVITQEHPTLGIVLDKTGFFLMLFIKLLGIIIPLYMLGIGTIYFRVLIYSSFDLTLTRLTIAIQDAFTIFLVLSQFIYEKCWEASPGSSSPQQLKSGRRATDNEF